MNAAHCSLSACGRSIIVSRTWTRLSTSMKMASASSLLRKWQCISLILSAKTKERLHCGERRMDRGTSNLDSYHRVELPHSSLEGLEVMILVGEDTETPVVYAQTYTRVYVLLRGLEPSITLGLYSVSVTSDECKTNIWS